MMATCPSRRALANQPDSLGFCLGFLAGVDGGGVAADVTGDLLSIVGFARASAMIKSKKSKKFPD